MALSMKMILLSGGLGLLGSVMAQEEPGPSSDLTSTVSTVTTAASTSLATVMASTPSPSSLLLAPAPAPAPAAASDLASSSPFTSAAIAGITLGAATLAVFIGLLAYHYGYRRVRARRAASMGNHRLSISCQGLSSPVHLSSGEIVTPTLELSPVASPERKS